MVTEMKFQGANAKYSVGPVSYDCDAVRAHLAISKDADGTFSVIVLNLRGCGSCGDTEEDSVANVQEAVAGVVASYKDDSTDVPWLDVSDYDDIPDGAKLKWIMVNV